MALEKLKNELWFREDLFPDVSQLIRVSKVLFHKTTKDNTGKKLQELLILDTPRFSKMLTLDGAVQFTEADEKYYHEPLVHCAMFSHANPKNVLIIGAGDGGVRGGPDARGAYEGCGGGPGRRGDRWEGAGPRRGCPVPGRRILARDEGAGQRGSPGRGGRDSSSTGSQGSLTRRGRRTP